MRLRQQLKKETEVSVTALDQAMREDSGEDDGGEESQADVLLRIAQESEPFHTSNGEAYADITKGDAGGSSHRETWKVRSRGFKDWLLDSYMEETGGGSVSGEAMNSALNTIEARARLRAPKREVFLRVGGQDGKIYLDLHNDAWSVVEIDVEGWRIIQNPPVRFRRPATQLELPIPVRTQTLHTKEAPFSVVAARPMCAYPTYPHYVGEGNTKNAESYQCREP